MEKASPTPTASRRFLSDGKNHEGPTVSIVTPFFNSAAYLEECIQSVISQTYSNWEYILVDNCSADGGAAIAEKYALSDLRIRFVKEVEFVGQVENYNRALRYISPTSKYSKIVQADDWIYPRCLEEMVAIAESSDNVGLVSSFTLYGNDLHHGGLSLSSGPVYRGRDAARAQLLGKTLFGSPTCVMYRSDVVRLREPFFSVATPYFEDTEVCFEILRDYDFGFVPQILTFNRRDNDSICAKWESHNFMLLYEIMFVHRFGPYFLDHAELTARVLNVEGRYYDLLAQGVLRSYGKDFWQFHSQGLKSIGLEISRRRMALHLLRIIADAATDPRRIVRSLWNRLKPPWHLVIERN